ncbi:MAG: S8 family serine peptidase [Alphaproteobacteria bacterium]
MFTNSSGILDRGVKIEATDDVISSSDLRSGSVNYSTDIGSFSKRLHDEFSTMTNSADAAVPSVALGSLFQAFKDELTVLANEDGFGTLVTDSTTNLFGNDSTVDVVEVSAGATVSASIGGSSAPMSGSASNATGGFYYMGNNNGVSALKAQSLLDTYGVGNNQTTVAVVDSKIDWNGTGNNNNSVLMDNQGAYFDFHSHNYTVTNSQYTHGTYVAGYVQYVSPDVTIDSYDIASSPGFGSTNAMLNSIYHAADRGVDVINISYGWMDSYGTGGLSGSTANALQNAFNYATGKGSMVVYSAGNSDSEHTQTLNNVMVVGASNSAGNKAWFSSYGDNEVDVFAPGESVSTMAIFGSGTSALNGTSFSAPIVAGIASLLRSVDANLTVAQITQKIIGSAVQSSSMQNYSIADGIANAANAFMVGTSASEHILGDSAANQLNGYGGNDKMHGGDGNDSMWAHDGNDRLYGGNGNDNMRGGNNNDVLIGGTGNDTMHGDNHNDVLHGWGGNDNMFGGNGNDRLYANQGNDTMDGGAGNDKLFGATGQDILKGGSGNDLINGGAEKDNAWGGSGADTFEIKNGDLVDWDNLSGDVEQRSDKLDVIEDFQIGQDKIFFNNFNTVNSRSDLAAWKTTLNGDVHFTIKVKDTNERFLVDVDSNVTWGQMFNDNNFDFA